MFYNLLLKYIRISTTQLLVPVVLVFALLFSFLSHAQHYDITVDSAEQNCQICQQYVDKTDNNIEVNHTLLSFYLGYTSHTYEFSYHANNSVTPPLRAPPVQR